MNDQKDLLIRSVLAEDRGQPKVPRDEWQTIEEKISSRQGFFSFKPLAFVCSLALIVFALGQFESRPTFSEQDKVDIYSYVLEDGYFDNSEEVSTWASVDSF
tara:strand:+ start:945 stop:1250 length:306 start_codon:yes stop_codon:yes gene_type:complete